LAAGCTESPHDTSITDTLNDSLLPPASPDADTEGFFTWLTGAQARSQTERLGLRAEQVAERTSIRKEQRDAYLAVLYYSEEMKQLISARREDDMGTREERLRRFSDRFLEQARREIGPARELLPPDR
jgi:hypothetical protein